MNFSVRELIVLAIFGAGLFVLDLLVSGITTVIGVPGTGGLVNAIFFVGLATIGGKIVKRFGTYTLMTLVYGVLASPTSVFGPPGVYKIFIVVFIGLIADIIILLCKYRPVGYYLGLAISNVLSIPIGLYTLIFLGLPGADALQKALFILMPIYFLESLIGAWLGLWLYEKRIKNLAVVRQLSSGEK